MEYRHEIIDFPSNLPIKIFIHRIGEVNMHWHQSTELLYVVCGDVEITVGKDVYRLKADDIILVNSNMPHSLHSENATLIAAQLKPYLLSSVPDDIKHASFNLTPESDGNLTFGLKNCIAELLKINMEKGDNLDLINTSVCYRLMYELYTNFLDKNTAGKNAGEQTDRLTMLLGYINSHYDRDLSLGALASVCYVTVPYLSKIFKNAMGMTVSEYVKSIRLQHAANEIIATSIPIEKISEQCGFPNAHSFTEAFKAKYGMLPSHWRSRSKKDGANSVNTSDRNKEKSIGYYRSDSSILYSSVSGFIEKYTERNREQTKPPVRRNAAAECTIEITAKIAVPLRRSCLTFIGVSRAKELMYDEIRRQLATAQREIGFKYVKMHSLLDDEMMVYNASGGREVYNFEFIDNIFDFLVSLNLKPYTEISFMPRALAAYPDKTTFYTNVITSPPSDYKKWNALIRKLTEHLLFRYGKKEVESWLFAVWNEPFTSERLFGFASYEEYYTFYENTYKSIKSVDENLPVGGPSHFCAYGKGYKPLTDFLNEMSRRGCLPDFADVHYYDIDMHQVYTDDNGVKICTPLSPTEKSFSIFADGIRKELESNGYGDIPIYLTEWNSTTSHRDLLSDTCFKSSYIVKNLTETYDMFDANGYWLLSDLNEENLLNNRFLHGGLGLFTYNGIKKPSFHAMKFLSGLGDELIDKGDGYFATRSEDKYIILLYNYHHYAIAYSEDAGINTDYLNRYNVFPDQRAKRLNLSLPQLEGNYLIEHRILNREYGSVFDLFLKTGGTEPLSKEDAEYLKQIAEPALLKQKMQSPINFSIELAPFEVRLIILSRI